MAKLKSTDIYGSLNVQGEQTTGSLTINGNMKLGDNLNKATIEFPTNISRTYTIPDAGVDADFVLTQGDQFISGKKTFADLIIGVSEQSNWELDGLSPQYFHIRDADDNIRLTLSNNGQLAIGTTIPTTSRLTVAGDISVSGGININGNFLGPTTENQGTFNLLTNNSKIDIGSANSVVNIPGNLEVSYNSSSNTFTSTTTTSAPFTILSTILVDNLNADLLDGQHGSYYLDNTITDISITHNATTVVVNSSDGTNGTINGATPTTSGVVTNAAQEWAGSKTFQNGVTVKDGANTGTSTMQYNSITKSVEFIFN